MSVRFAPGDLFLAIVKKRIKSVDQRFAAGPQLADALPGYFVQDAMAPGQECGQHLPAVFAATQALDVAVFLHAVDQFHGAVVLESQALG